MGMIDEDEIAKIGFKRSGYGAGDIDYSIIPYRIQELNDTDALDLKNTLISFNRRMTECVHERLTGKKKRWFWNRRHLFQVLRKPRKYYFWPIRFGWASYEWSTFLSTHGWQIDSRYGWTLHIGRFQIRFGRSR